MAKTMRSWGFCLIVFGLAFALAIAWQRSFGAYRNEFGGHPDEAAHVVTGLFIRDSLVEATHYVLGDAHGSPIRFGKDFADRYYNHYPKIGLGVWPPVFYLAQSAWTLVFGATRASLFLLMAGLAATLALMLVHALRGQFGVAIATIAAALLISLPLVREYYGMIMAETLSAIFMFGAMLAFGDFLDEGKRGRAIAFGVLASLAILTKGTGLALALAAPLAVLLTRRFSILRRPALWGAVAIIAVVAGPWTWATRNLGKGGWLQPNPSWSFTAQAIPYYATKFAFALGGVVFVLFVAGIIATVRFGTERRGRWAAVGALIPSVLVFQSIAPVGLEARHLIPALPAAMMFAAAGFAFVFQRLKALGQGIAIGFSVLVLAGTLWTLLPLKHKGSAGFAPLARQMLAVAKPQDVALVSSDATGEGMFIAAVALHEKRPGHVIQRASKSLASSTWSGSGYAPAFDKDEDALKFLTSGEIRFLVLDDSVPAEKRREHHEQLQRLVANHGDRFRLIADSSVTRTGEAQASLARLYEILSEPHGKD